MLFTHEQCTKAQLDDLLIYVRVLTDADQLGHDGLPICLRPTNFLKAQRDGKAPTYMLYHTAVGVTCVSARQLRTVPAKHGFVKKLVINTVVGHPGKKITPTQWLMANVMQAEKWELQQASLHDLITYGVFSLFKSLSSRGQDFRFFHSEEAFQAYRKSAENVGSIPASDSISSTKDEQILAEYKEYARQSIPATSVYGTPIRWTDGTAPTNLNQVFWVVLPAASQN